MRVVAWQLLVSIAAAALPAQTFHGKTATEWVEGLAAADQQARDIAVSSLVSMGDHAVDAALRALDDDRPTMREHAAIALGRIGAAAARARERLVALAADPHAGVAHAAKVAAMRVHVDVAMLPELRAALASPDWHVQLAAADVLAQLGRAAWPAAADLVEVLQRADERLDATVVLELPDMPAQRWNVRASAARALGVIGPVFGVASAEALRARLRHADAFVRERVVQALAGMANVEPTILGLLRVLQQDEAASVRRAAATTLTRLVPGGHPFVPTVVPRMIQALHDHDGGVRRLAVDYLGARGRDAVPAVETLAAMLATGQQEVITDALRGLRGLGPWAVGAKDALINLYQTFPPDQLERREVLEVLARVAPGARAELPELDALLTARAEMAANPAVVRQQLVVETLAALQAPEHEDRERIVRAVVSQRIREAIPHLLQWLDARRPGDQQRSALEALLALDAEAAVAPARSCLESSDPELRVAAARVLAMFGDTETRQRTVTVLAEAIDRANPRELRKLALTRVPELVPWFERVAFDGETLECRSEALVGLGELGVQGIGPRIAAILGEITKSTTTKADDANELLSTGLWVLATVDAEPHRDLFAVHAKAVDERVQRSAWFGLATLGDEQARAQLGEHAPAIRHPLQEQLSRTHLRLGQVYCCQLREVLALLRRSTGVAVTLAAAADPTLLDQRLVGYALHDVLGLRPTAAEVLGCLASRHVFQPELVATFHGDRIELAPEDAGAGSTGR